VRQLDRVPQGAILAAKEGAPAMSDAADEFDEEFIPVELVLIRHTENGVTLRKIDKAGVVENSWHLDPNLEYTMPRLCGH
jgi:hypothetical protein